MLSLAGKTVFITGASAGIGAACAATFAAAGARLLLCARRLEKLNDLAAAWRTAHDAEIRTLPLNVRNAEAVEQALQTLPSDWQPIDILVNNAGLARGLDPVYANEIRHINDMVDTNVKGLLYVTRAVVPGMLERGAGHIINLGSTAGHEVYPGGTIYCATKHAVGAITRGLKMDLHGTPLRVTTIDPGLVETDFSLARFEGDQARADAVYSTTTALQPEDVADAALYAATRPPHVNIAEVILMPTVQSSATMLVRE